MSNLWSAPGYVDGNFAVAAPCSLPVFSSPLPTTGEAYMFTQDFMQFLVNWTATAYGTAYTAGVYTPDLRDYKLIFEGPREDMGGGIVKWKRTYAKVPATYNEWSNMAYNFIGSGPGNYALTTGYTGRYRTQALCCCRTQRDFFLIPSVFVDPITGSTVNALTEGDIPTIRALQYCVQYTQAGTQYGGYFYRQDYVCDAAINSNAGYLFQTSPTATEYLAMIEDAATNGWNAAVSRQVLTGTNPIMIDVNSTIYGGQICAEDSRISRLNNTGPIWCRETRYVLAQ